MNTWDSKKRTREAIDLRFKPRAPYALEKCGTCLKWWTVGCRCLLKYDNIFFIIVKCLKFICASTRLLEDVESPTKITFWLLVEMLSVVVSDLFVSLLTLVCCNNSKYKCNTCVMCFFLFWLFLLVAKALFAGSKRLTTRLIYYWPDFSGEISSPCSSEGPIYFPEGPGARERLLTVQSLEPWIPIVAL